MQFQINTISKKLENFNIIFNNYNETEYSQKILINLIEIIGDCILELKKQVKISDNLQKILNEISNTIEEYKKSPMVFKKKDKLIIANKEYKLCALTKDIVKNYYDNLIREIKTFVENGKR
ncbi:hypothetical protein HOK68_00765 [Candidatus Woesearchaeota archaeon]|nr:hypothetical protein [Candidatus Woesearchaeota archaeon]MBT4387776.1 hypothetical protein [Candidatus Woesearchaeota archaeon]MBT4595595.1 hypothetical protein [Candidatus Woesearchaeota archaeon]MBT5740922.1 hypothetical protein [Candidatus Woesearchaeota archaeon]MBT6505292.1 hypothetical protein [Candidatus Woesearchaeota archaeon]